MSGESPIKKEGARVSGVRLSGSERKRLEGEPVTLDRFLSPVPIGEEVLHPGSFFDRDSPVELEVGCGRGAFLVAAAEMFPNVNFIGVELAGPFARVAASRMARRGLTNVRILYGDAGRLVRKTLEGESLASIHVYFPDPWPKKRHRKRRVFRPEFLQGVRRVLAPEGILSLATDFVEYYESMRSLVDSDGSFERLVAYELAGGGGATNFERKYLKEGRVSHRVSYRKRSIDTEWSRL